MFDFIRIASMVPNVSVGGVEYNLNEIIKMADKAEVNGVDITVFPELCISSYTCGDIFLWDTLLSASKNAVKTLAERSKNYTFTMFVGTPLVVQNQLYNCAVAINNGKILAVIPKTFIPNYNEFYEKRWFSSSMDLQCENISSDLFGIEDDYQIPIGRDIVLNINSIKIGTEVCEDLWSPLAPSTFLALGGAEIIVNLSGSNETIAKAEYRKELVKQQSARNICAYVYTSAGSKESTTDLIFSGKSLIAENGSVIKENEKLIDTDYFIMADIDLGKIRYDRINNKSFKDAINLYSPMQKVREIKAVDNRKMYKAMGEINYIARMPFVPSTQKDRAERCMNIFNMQVAGLKKRMEVAGTKLVIGVSGGLDSTLALLVCCMAVKEMGLPATEVHGITMPCFGTTNRTYNNSVELMKTLGVTLSEINIREACLLHYKDIGHDVNVHDLTFENGQARERTQVLMDYASRVGGFVVGTGDLSELALGWCTYNADHMSMYGVNSSIPKTLIKWMVESVTLHGLFESSTEVLKDVIDTPISPELLPPDENGDIAQETESIVGPYELHDFFLYYAVRFGFSPKKIYHLAKLAYKDSYDEKIILKWIRIFYRRFFTQQFKRSCLPDGVKVGSICLSPRGDFRMPSDASFNIWMKEIDEI